MRKKERTYVIEKGTIDQLTTSLGSFCTGGPLLAFMAAASSSAYSLKAHHIEAFYIEYTLCRTQNCRLPGNAKHVMQNLMQHRKDKRNRQRHSTNCRHCHRNQRSPNNLVKWVTTIGNTFRAWALII